ITVIRSQGLAPLRPEKGWRPIITVTFDHQHHEVVLGSDGQNPNLKRPFYLRYADPKSPVDIDVWHKSQSKKKARKRNQVASIRLSLEEVLKRQGSEPKTEIRLNCHSAVKRGQNGRSKQQNAACLHIKLRPPASYASLSESSTLNDLNEDTLSHTSNTLTSPCTPTSTDFDLPEVPGPVEQQKLRRRRVRGYSVDPDNEDMDDECSIEDDPDDYCFVEEDTLLEPADLDCADGVIGIPPKSIGPWLVASLLPRYVDQISVESTMSAAESTVSRFSIYRELRDASLDEDFEKVLKTMMTEWTFVGACVSEVVVLDATIFSTTSGGTNVPQSTSGFQITRPTQQLIAISSIFTGLGLAIDAWFMLRYGMLNAATFRRNALDVYDTYLSFSVTSRMPITLTFLSACSLMGFLVIVSATVWPTAAIVLCGIAGVACTLQYLIYGLHSVWCFGQRMLRGIRNGVVRGCARVFRKATSADNFSANVVVDPTASPPSADTRLPPPSADTRLPPPAHCSITTIQPPIRPPRNPARMATTS
ncbi:hypothetical protein PILCRDRAFT_77105, partial [Piloderma croceum F 1598]